MKKLKKHKNLYTTNFTKATLLLVCFILGIFIQGCNGPHRKPAGEMKETGSVAAEGEADRGKVSAEKKEKQPEMRFVIEEWKEITPEEQKKRNPDKPDVFLPGQPFLNGSPASPQTGAKSGNEENIWERHMQLQLKEARANRKETLERYRKLGTAEEESIRKQALKEYMEASAKLKKLEEKMKRDNGF